MTFIQYQVVTIKSSEKSTIFFIAICNSVALGKKANDYYVLQLSNFAEKQQQTNKKSNVFYEAGLWPKSVAHHYSWRYANEL